MADTRWSRHVQGEISCFSYATHTLWLTTVWQVVFGLEHHDTTQRATLEA